jgi:hypothetical protein
MPRVYEILHPQINLFKGQCNVQHHLFNILICVLTEFSTSINILRAVTGWSKVGEPSTLNIVLQPRSCNAGSSGEAGT